MAKKKVEVKEPTIWEKIKQIWKDQWKIVRSSVKDVWTDFKVCLISFAYGVFDFIAGLIKILFTFIVSVVKSAYTLIVEWVINWIKHL